MSAILGYFNINSDTSDVFSIEKMAKPLLNRGDEGLKTYQDRNIILGQALSFNTVQSRYEKLPYEDLSGNYAIVSKSRIDNRQELAKLLSIDEANNAGIPDSILILGAYRKWGSSCSVHLEGEWVFAIWDKCKEELFISRDYQGNKELFFFHSNNFFAFSSSIKSLLELEHIPKKVNEVFIAKTLTSFSNKGETTAYDSIYRLPPAHYLTVSKKGILKHQYWNLNNLKILNWKDPNDYIVRFLELYTQSVRNCLNSYGEVGSMLSGGLDSGSITAIAARELQRENKILKTYSSVPLYPDCSSNFRMKFGDETPFIKATIDFTPNIQPHFITGHENSPLQGIYKNYDIRMEPGHAAGNYFWILSILQKAKEEGVKTLLSGQGGNATISWPGQKAITFAECILKNKMLKSFFKQEMKRILINSIGSYKLSDLKNRTAWTDYSAIDNNFAKKIELRKLMKEQGHNPYFLNGNNALVSRLKIIRPGNNQIGTTTQCYASEYGIEMRDPTLNRQLMEFCLSIPDKFFRDDDYDRLIIRKAMVGYLPDEVRLNKRRGLQSADITQRLHLIAKEIQQELDMQKQSELARKILDIEKMQNVLNEINSTNSNRYNSSATTILLRGIDTGYFLRKFEESY